MNQMTRIEPAAIEAPARITVAEFMAIVGADIFKGAKAELDRGAIVRMSPSLTAHTRYVSQFQAELIDIFGLKGPVRALPSVSILAAADTVREIDLALVRGFGDDGEFFDPATILLAIEISSTTLAYDLGPKRADYAAVGISHYWVVDVEGRRVHVMSNPLDGDYTERHLVPFGQPLTVPGTDRTITIA